MEIQGFIATGVVGFLIGWGLELVPHRWLDHTEWILGALMVVFAIFAPRGTEDGFGPVISLLLLFGVAVFAITRWQLNRRRSDDVHP